MNDSQQQVGPVGDAEFDTLVQSGTIRPDTYVWKDGVIPAVD